VLIKPKRSKFVFEWVRIKNQRFVTTPTDSKGCQLKGSWELTFFEVEYVGRVEKGGINANLLC